MVFSSPLQGVDIRHNKDRKVRRKEPKSQDIYLRLLVKVRLGPKTPRQGHPGHINISSRASMLVLVLGSLQGSSGQARISAAFP